MDLEKYRRLFAREYREGYSKQTLHFKIRETPKNPPYQRHYAHELENRIKRLIADPEMPGIAYRRDGFNFLVTIENIKWGDHIDMAGRAYDTVFSREMMEPVRRLGRGRPRLGRGRRRLR